MSKAEKIWLIVATPLVIVGIIIFGGAMMALNWDFTKLSTEKLETNEYVLDRSFENISIVTSTADVIFVPSTEAKVVCVESENMKHSVSVEDGTLTVKIQDTRKWYEHITFFNFANHKLTVYLPSGEYGNITLNASTGKVTIPKDLSFKNIEATLSTGKIICEASAKELIKIKTTTGKIELEGVNAETVDLSVTTGKITAKAVNCKQFISNGSTGDVRLESVIASRKLTVKRDTGDVKVDRCDSNEIYIETSTGSIKGTLLSDKIFTYDTETGDVDLPKSKGSETCELKTETGDIKISIVK